MIIRLRSINLNVIVKYYGLIYQQNNYYYYTACNAPYVSRREASDHWRGWPSLVVTQPSTSHHLLCVQCASVCMETLNR